MKSGKPATTRAHKCSCGIESRSWPARKKGELCWFCENGIKKGKKK